MVASFQPILPKPFGHFSLHGTSVYLVAPKSVVLKGWSMPDWCGRRGWLVRQFNVFNVTKMSWAIPVRNDSLILLWSSVIIKPGHVMASLDLLHGFSQHTLSNSSAAKRSIDWFACPLPQSHPDVFGLVYSTCFTQTAQVHSNIISFSALGNILFISKCQTLPAGTESLNICQPQPHQSGQYWTRQANGV